jgi:hypothetical protein
MSFMLVIESNLVLEVNNGGWTCSIICIMNKFTQFKARVGKCNEQRAAGDNIQMCLMRGGGDVEADKVTCCGHSLMMGFTFVDTEPYVTCNSKPDTPHSYSLKNALKQNQCASWPLWTMTCSFRHEFQ